MIFAVAGTGCTTEGVSYSGVGVPPTQTAVTITGPNSGNATSKTVGQVVNFTCDRAGNNTTIAWDFGDGIGTSTSEDPSYTFLSAGTRTVTATVTDNNGSVVLVDTIVITVDPAPVAIISAPADNAVIADHTEAITFGSTGSVGTGLTYLWDFGDSTTATTAAPSKTYANASARTISLIVTDRNGVASAAETIDITFTA